MESTPARIALRMPSGPSAWAAVRRPALRASLTPAVNSSSVSWAANRSADVWGRDPTGGHELDDVSALLELRSHRLAHGIGPVRLPTHPMGVAAGDGDGKAGGQDARPRTDPVGDGVLEIVGDATRTVGVEAAAGPEVAHRGEAGFDLASRVARGAEQRHGIGFGRHLRGRAHAAVEAQVDVGVDQAGEDRPSAEVNPPRTGRRLAGTDGNDSLAVGHDMADEGLAPTVDDEAVAQRDGHRFLPSDPPGGGVAVWCLGALTRTAGPSGRPRRPSSRG